MRSLSDRTDLLRSRARADPGGLAVDDRGSRVVLTWAGLDREADLAASALAGLGARRGDRVAIAAPAGSDFAAALHGAARLGASLVPLSPRGRAAELALPLASCRPRVTLGWGTGTVAALDAALARGPGGTASELAELRRRSEKPGATGPGVSDPHGLAARDELCVVHTSGTTGRPRGVRLTLDNQVASARGCAESLGLLPSDHWLLALAPHHIGGLAVLVRSAVLGHPVTIIPRFDEAAVLAALTPGGPTVVPLVPTMLARLVAAGGTGRLRRLHAVLLGGAPATPADLEGWCRAGIPVCPTYGLTETGSQVATVSPGSATAMGAGAGRPHRFARLRILAEDGGRRPVAPGHPGRIEVRGRVISPGYVGADPGDGPDEGPGHGRFLTRDRGRIDADGLLHVLGRVDDAILSGGETVHPEEVEAVLLAHPLVRDAAVVGLPDRLWGRRVVAVLVTDPASRPEAERLLPAFCRAELSGSRLPRGWVFAEQLPRSEGGKLRRGELVEQVRRAERAQAAGGARPRAETADPPGAPRERPGVRPGGR